MRRHRRAAAFTLAAAAAVFGLYGLATLAPSPALAAGDAVKDKISRLRIGELRKLEPLDPPLSAPGASFNDMSGAAPVETSLADYKGRVVLLNFWASWCGPCLVELPSLDRLAGQVAASDLAEDVAVIGVGIDRMMERGQAALDELEIRNLAFLHDHDNDLSLGLNVRAMPSTFLIDRDGHVVARYVGAAEWDAPEVMTLLETLAAEKPSESAPTGG